MGVPDKICVRPASETADEGLTVENLSSQIRLRWPNSIPKYGIQLNCEPTF